MKLYVGNLPWNTTDADLEALFTKVGQVTSARVISDRETGRSRGFGFVEMPNADAQRAIAELNGQNFESRALRVNEANEPKSRGAGGGGGGGGGGGDRGGDRGGRNRW